MAALPRTIRIGAYEVTAISDGHLPATVDLLTNIDPDIANSLQQQAGEDALSRMHILTYLVQGRGRMVLIDAGAGGLRQWGGDLLPALARLGTAPEDIEAVLLTHAHPDHVGGLVEESGRRVFPNATLIVSPDEVSFWQDDDILAHASDRVRANARIARAAFEAYANNLSQIQKGKVLPGIDAIPLPGHTPGHIAYRIDAAPNGLLFWGDTVHFPAVQLPHPEATVLLDNDPAAAAAARAEVLELAADEALVIAGAHLDNRGFARVIRSDGGYSLANVD